MITDKETNFDNKKGCSHRFKNDLMLQYVQGWEPTCLIIGTFNPEWNENNSAEWFYGRTSNNYFWEILPRLYGQLSLLSKGRKDWLIFCKKYKIAITDLILTISDANKSNPEHLKAISHFSDRAIEKNFHNFLWTDIKSILEKYRLIKNIYLTRSEHGIWGKRWREIKKKSDSREIHFATLLTPSANARFQYKKIFSYNYLTLQDFLICRWKNKWHNVSI